MSFYGSFTPTPMPDPDFDAIEPGKLVFAAAKAITASHAGELQGKPVCRCCERPVPEPVIHRLDGLAVCGLCAESMREALVRRQQRLCRGLLEISRPNKPPFPK